jgi:hypothetical protein
MSTLQHDELLTQSEILEKETLPPEKEADQHAEAAPDEAYNKTAVSWQHYVIDFTVGWSFGEPQVTFYCDRQGCRSAASSILILSSWRK